MNKNLKRKLGIITLAAVGSVAFSFGAMNIEKASAETAFDTAKIQMIKGASVRYYPDSATTAESGIRFSSAIKSSDYTALEGMETDGVKVSYGMLIAPYDYFTTYGEFNAATVFGVDGEKKYTWDGETVDGDATYTKIAHVTYDTLIASSQVGYEDCHEIKGSLLKIKDENLTKEFVGRGYIKYETTEGVSYKFADFVDGKAENNARSIVYVSQVLVDQGNQASTWVNEQYISKVTEQATTYTIETYVGDEIVKTQKVDTKVNANLQDVVVETYEGFDLVSAETTGKAYANGRLTLKHVYKELENTKYQVQNGDFETGDLNGWTLTGNIGAVSSETNYWRGDALNADGFPFGLDGTYMFSAYAVDGLEGNKGVLKSSAFTVAQSGWITYKLGGAKNNEYVYVDVVEAETDNILKRYSNQNHKYEEAGNIRLGCELNAYKANVQDLVGKEVYLRVSDYASADFGLFFLDSVDTLHLAEPKGYTLANEVAHQNTIYDLYNGGFESGMNGWTKTSNIGDISEADTDWFGSFDRVGKFFSCYAPDQSEGSRGILTSNVFEIGGSGWITFHLGGVKNPDQVYMEVIDAITGVKYGHFYNEFMVDCKLIRYKADLSAYVGKLVYINFVDNATGDYGLIFCDEFKTYYANVSDIPAEYVNVAVNKVESIYNVMNGGFETGNLLGWTLVDGAIPGFITDEDYYWRGEGDKTTKIFNKVGTYLFTGVETVKHDLMESAMGTIQSNTFILKKNSVLSFKMGGGPNDNIYVRLVRADGTEIARYNNNEKYCKDGEHQNGRLVEHVYELNNTEEMVCYFQICDYAERDWGLIAIDEITITQKA